MKRYSFGTFEVDDTNRQAFETCRSVADLDRVSPMPVILVGGEASGKTHLLYSVVNRVRAGAAKTGLAYVTAHDFPDQVRALIGDPVPVRRAQSAILLVDQLEQFDRYRQELEDVVRIFLDSSHSVILASRTRPDLLRNLSDGLRRILLGGRIVEIAAAALDGEALAEPDRVTAVERWPDSGVSPTAASRLSAEEPSPQRAIEDAAVSDRETSELRYQVAALEAEWRNAQGKAAKLKSMLDETLAEKTGLETEVSKLRTQVAELEDEWRAAQNRNSSFETALAQKAASAAQADDIREQLAALQGQYELLMTERTRGASLPDDERAALDGRVLDLQEELAEARRESAVARQEANQLVQRAEGLLAQVESNRLQLSEAKKKHEEEVENLQAEVAQQHLIRATTEELAELRAQRDEAQAQREQLREELLRSREDAVRSQRSLEDELSAAKSEYLRIRDERVAWEKRDRELEALIRTLRDELESVKDTRDTALAQVKAAEVDRDAALAQVESAASAHQEALRSAEDIMERAAALERQHARAVDEISRLTADADAIAAERDEYRARSENLDTERATLDAVIGQLRDDLAAQSAEAEAARREAERQAEGARLLGEKLRKRLSDVYTAFDLTRQTNRVVGVGLEGIRQQLQETDEALEKLASRLTASAGVSGPGVVETPDDQAGWSEDTTLGGEADAPGGGAFDSAPEDGSSEDA